MVQVQYLPKKWFGAEGLELTGFETMASLNI